MVSSGNSAQVFRNLKNDLENTKCLECNSLNPAFASVNNGCFICSNCIELHSVLDPSISRIKALDDIWEENDLKLMIAGGNSSIKEFFSHYSMENSPPNVKYLSKAGFYYREMLNMISQDKEYEHNCPSVDEGREMAGFVNLNLAQDLNAEVKIIKKEKKIDSEEPNEETKNLRFDDQEKIPVYGYEKTQVLEESKIKAEVPEQEKIETLEPGKKSRWQWAKNAYKKAVAAGNKTADKISEKISKFAEKPAMKKVETKTIEFTNKIETGMNNFINKVKSKPAVKNTLDKFNHAAHSIGDEFVNTANKISTSEPMQKIKSSFKKKTEEPEPQE
ncbi:hypothetical protein SteCoe_37184 [Stentor coeruleus]|uniref:Arf-GAP domain-containing protein n=1 Tax=Stentor coeruleus TaxID=5963 RepID=A0A1R2ANN0_9CILI|nr:hypothetical protein SteCoe_37184 [Stentor coeruleus]